LGNGQGDLKEILGDLRFGRKKGGSQTKERTDNAFYGKPRTASKKLERGSPKQRGSERDRGKGPGGVFTRKKVKISGRGRSERGDGRAAEQGPT